LPYLSFHVPFPEEHQSERFVEQPPEKGISADKFAQDIFYRVVFQ
jgi:hypothetical protein